MAKYFNNNLKHIRAILNISQQQIADELGISRSYVSRIETKVQNKLKKYVKWQE